MSPRPRYRQSSVNDHSSAIIGYGRSEQVSSQLQPLQHSHSYMIIIWALDNQLVIMILQHPAICNFYCQFLSNKVIGEAGRSSNGNHIRSHLMMAQNSLNATGSGRTAAITWHRNAISYFRNKSLSNTVEFRSQLPSLSQDYLNA